MTRTCSLLCFARHIQSTKCWRLGEINVKRSTGLCRSDFDLSPAITKWAKAGCKRQDKVPMARTYCLTLQIKKIRCSFVWSKSSDFWSKVCGHLSWTILLIQTHADLWVRNESNCRAVLESFCWLRRRWWWGGHGGDYHSTSSCCVSIEKFTSTTHQGF